MALLIRRHCATDTNPRLADCPACGLLMVIPVRKQETGNGNLSHRVGCKELRPTNIARSAAVLKLKITASSEMHISLNHQLSFSMQAARA